MSADDPNALVNGLVRIHLVITRGVDVARQHSRGRASGDAANEALAAGFADYVQALVSVLHGHHTGEEAIVFPALRDRFPGAPWALLTDEHRAIVPILAALEEQATLIRQDPSPATWTRVADLLDRLADLWAPHHEREEAEFTAELVASKVPLEEQAALVASTATHSQQHTGPEYLVVPFLLYNLDGDQRRAMGAFFPPVVTEQLVPVAWQEKWKPMKPFLVA
jgi:hemerythrin-like domain-containing protein